MNPYKLARGYTTAKSLLTNKPRRTTRAKNIAVGRVLARIGIWSRLWKIRS